MTEPLKGPEFFEEGHLSIVVFRPFADFNREPHSHGFYEGMIVPGGVAVHQLGNPILRWNVSRHIRGCGDDKRFLAKGDTEQCI